MRTWSYEPSGLDVVLHRKEVLFLNKLNISPTGAYRISVCCVYVFTYIDSVHTVTPRALNRPSVIKYFPVK